MFSIIQELGRGILVIALTIFSDYHDLNESEAPLMMAGLPYEYKSKCGVFAFEDDTGRNGREKRLCSRLSKN